MKAIATKVRASALQVGDLFSTGGPEYWDTALQGLDGSVGQKVYIRTETPAEAGGADVDVYKITLEPL